MIALDQIYGIGGWRHQVEAVAEELAAREAHEDFRAGRFRLFEFSGEPSQSSRRIEKTTEGFEVWIPRFHPELGQAHTYSTRVFVEEYNQIMRRMMAKSREGHTDAVQ